jgi:hypothetical protein
MIITRSPLRTSLQARLAMAGFYWLIRPKLNSSHRDWQMIGRARAVSFTVIIIPRLGGFSPR